MEIFHRKFNYHVCLIISTEKTANFQSNLKFVKIAGIDPLNMGDFVIDTGVKMKIKQYKAYGSSNFICEKVTLPSLGKVVKLSAILKFPTLKAESGYELDWKIGPIDIKGTGKSYAWFENLRVNFQLSGVRETRSGVEYIKIQNVKAKTQVNGLRVKFENLFNGNKALEDASNELINQNIQILIKEVTPKFEIALGKIGLRLANQVFSKIPADLLFPN